MRPLYWQIKIHKTNYQASSNSFRWVTYKAKLTGNSRLTRSAGLSSLIRKWHNRWSPSNSSKLSHFPIRLTINRGLSNWIVKCPIIMGKRMSSLMLFSHSKWPLCKKSRSSKCFLKKGTGHEECCFNLK